MPSPSPSQTGLITEFQMVVNASPTLDTAERSVSNTGLITPFHAAEIVDLIPSQAGTTTFVHSQVTTDPTHRARS